MAALALALLISTVEPPPAQYAQGPVTAARVFVANPHAMCTAVNGALPPGLRYRECYAPAVDIIVLPSDCDPSRGKIGETCKALTAHAEGHARGWRHAH